MDIKTISAQLRALATSNVNRSNTARLRDVIDDVEFALSAGVSRSLIIEQLAKNGLVFTLPNFENSLYRIRKKRIETPAQKTTSEAGKTKNSEVNNTPIKPSRFQYDGSKNPEELY